MPRRRTRQAVAHAAALITVGLLGVMPACGYRWVRGDRLFGQQRIAVMPFFEATAMGMAPELGRELHRRLAAAGAQVVSDRNQADAVLNGEIHFATLPTASRAGIAAYQVVATVDASLSKRQGEVLWHNQVILREDFLPASGVDVQPLLTETHRRTAIHRLAEKAATWVHDALTVASAVGEEP